MSMHVFSRFVKVDAYSGYLLRLGRTDLAKPAPHKGPVFVHREEDGMVVAIMVMADPPVRTGSAS